jgi:hypothetical protein
MNSGSQPKTHIYRLIEKKLSGGIAFLYGQTITLMPDSAKVPHKESLNSQYGFESPKSIGKRLIFNISYPIRLISIPEGGGFLPNCLSGSYYLSGFP